MKNLSCPNRNLPEWKALVAKVGTFEAYRDYLETNGEIRDPEVVFTKVQERTNLIKDYKYNQNAGRNLETIPAKQIENLQSTVEYQLLNESNQELPSKGGQAYVFLKEKDAKRFAFLLDKHKEFPETFRITSLVTKYEKDLSNPLIYNPYNIYRDFEYIKSNKNKRSNLYDIVDLETGEVLASKVRVLHTSKDVKSTIAEKYGMEFTPTKVFSANRSIAFALYRQKPSKAKYIAQAKRYLYDAIKFLNPEESSLKINLDKIESLLESFPEEMWDYINTTYSPENSTNINASIGLQNTIKFNLPKLGLLEEVEKITGKKLQGTSFKNYDRTGGIKKVLNVDWGNTVVIDYKKMTTKELRKAISYYLTSTKYFKTSSEEENVRKYAEHKRIDYNELKELVFGSIDKAIENIAYNTTGNSDEMEVSKWRESIRNYDWQTVELFSKPYEKFNEQAKQKITEKFKDKILSNNISHLDYFFSGNFNWLNINFNNISGQYYMADMETESAVGIEKKMMGIINPFEMHIYTKPKAGENFLKEEEVFNRLAAVLHEPFHALHALSYNTVEERALRDAFDRLYKTDFGKEMMDQIFGSGYNKGQQISYDTLYKEFTAFTTQLMLYPKEWIQKTDLRSNDIFDFIQKVQTLQDKTYEELVKTQEKIGTIETVVTEEERAKLNFLQKLYNYIVKALQNIIPLSKNFLTTIPETNLVSKTVIEDVFGTVEEKITKTLKLPETVKKSKEEFLQAMEDLKSAINTLMQIDGKAFNSKNINDFFTTSAYRQEAGKQDLKRDLEYYQGDEALMEQEEGREEELPIEPTTEVVKPGVQELFESNPELANDVYEALGFKTNITQDNKSYYRGQIEQPTIDKDGNLVLYGREDELYKRAGLKSYGVSMTDDLQSAIDYGNGQLEVAQNVLEEEYGYDVLGYDFENKIQEIQDNGYYLIQIPKDISNEVVKEAGEVKIIGDKIIIPKGQYKIEQVIDGIETPITPQQKQQAQQLYSQYLESLNKPNTNPIFKGNQQEQLKKFVELQERLNNKEFLEGAKNAYESTPVLQQLGTQEEYNDYIARVSLGILKNPTSGGYNYTSQVKDIVYHGSPQYFEHFDKSKLGSYTGAASAREGIFFGSSVDVSKAYLDKRGKTLNLESLIENKYGKDISDKISKGFNYVASGLAEKVLGYKPERVTPADEYDDTYGIKLKDGSILYDNGEYNGSNKDAKFLQAFIKRKKELKLTYDVDYGGYIDKDRNITDKPFENLFIRPFILSIDNPLITSDEGKSYREESYYERIKTAKENNKNGVVIQDTYDSKFQTKPENIYVVFEPEQIHRLGGKQDIEGFKKFISTQPQAPVSTTLPGPETKINIYASTGENAELSNFANRPFTDDGIGDLGMNYEEATGKSIVFNTVEGFFQASKIQYSNSSEYWDKSKDAWTLTKRGIELIEKFAKATGSEARSLGRTIKELDTKEWDKYSSQEMKGGLLASFEQNPNALAKLLATGNATLTHTQDTGKWGTEFPRLLMEVRNELRGVQPQAPTTTDKFAKKNIFTVTPQQGVSDNKAKAKASIATQYIGFGEGIVGKDGKRSSTQIYREQVGVFANTGNYSSNDVIFVSVPGLRGDEAIAKREQDKTIKEAIKAVEAGATILTDNKKYIDSSAYNTGEKKLYNAMQDKRYNYSEITVDGQTIGTWSKLQTPVEVIPAGKAKTTVNPKIKEETDALVSAINELRSQGKDIVYVKGGIGNDLVKSIPGKPAPATQSFIYLSEQLLKANILNPKLAKVVNDPQNETSESGEEIIQKVQKDIFGISDDDVSDNLLFCIADL